MFSIFLQELVGIVTDLPQLIAPFVRTKIYVLPKTRTTQPTGTNKTWTRRTTP